MRLLAVGMGFTFLLALPAAAPQVAPKPPNRLLTAKLISVTSMPSELDQWIIEDLRAWGKYRVSTDPEGADLVFRAEKPEKETEYKLKKGVPQPKKEKRGKPFVLSITVIDWVSNQPLWHADILDEKPNKDENEPKGPEIRIYGHGLKPDELAAKVTREFRQYVTQLQSSESTKP